MSSGMVLTSMMEYDMVGCIGISAKGKEVLNFLIGKGAQMGDIYVFIN